MLSKQLPDLENGNMVFMMSKSAYLYDAGDHNGPHLMFFTALKDGKDWGAGAPGSPVFSGPYCSYREFPDPSGSCHYQCSDAANRVHLVAACCALRPALNSL